jgi:cyclase
MLKKRLIGVVTVKNGWAVQSFGYRHYLPLGRPECLVENLDRWGADEILVQVIDRQNIGPDFELVKRLGKLGLHTPLIYAGGLNSINDGIKLIRLGSDRIVIDTLLHEDLSSVINISKRLGAQALIASIPLSWNGNELDWYDYRFKTSSPISDAILNLIQSDIVSEILISDWKHEGKPGGFEKKLIQKFPSKEPQIIAFGGLSEPEQIKAILEFSQVSAVAIGNFLSYREHAIQKYREILIGMPLRPASYEPNLSLIAH